MLRNKGGILDLARIEHGKLAIRREVCDLFGCVEETVDMFANDCAKKDIALSLYLINPTHLHSQQRSRDYKVKSNAII